MIGDIKHFTYVTLKNALFFHENTLFFVIGTKSGFYPDYRWTDLPYLQGELYAAVISMFK